MGVFLRRLRLLDVTTVYPLLLFLLSQDPQILPAAELEGMLVDLEIVLGAPLDVWLAYQELQQRVPFAAAQPAKSGARGPGSVAQPAP